MIKPEFSRVNYVETSVRMDRELQARHRQTSTPENDRRHFGYQQARHFAQYSAANKPANWEKSSKERQHVSAKGQPKKYESYRDICKELHGIEKALYLCHQDLTSNYMKNIMKDTSQNKFSNDSHVVVLQDLFQRILTEMDHLRTMLSHCNEMMENTGDLSISSLPAQTLFSDTVKTDDFVYTNGPLTENTVVNTLKERFIAQQYHTSVGPVLLAVNPFGQCETQEDIHQEANKDGLLRKFLTQALDQLFHNQTPQLVILSGESCSGKSFTAQVLIHQLLHVTCGGIQTDLAKQLLSSVTVLRSLGKAKTTSNADSSRVAKLYEFYFSNRIISKARIHCYPLDMSRIVRPRDGERNFHVFYQLFAGLSPKDRAKLQLQTHSAQELRYLYNYPANDHAEIELLRNQFQLWKVALSVLGIPFADVSKVLAAILLLGNVHFMEKSTNVLEVQGGDFELKSVALLLGVPYTSIFRSLTKRTKVVKGEIVVQSCPASQANCSRDALSKALYSRTLSAILRRCNSSRKTVLTPESSPNSSNESLTKTPHNFKSPHDGLFNVSDNSVSMIGDTKSDKTFGIADLFGFESSKCNGMEEMCCNLCSETIQNFYTAHIFKSTERYYREEEIANEVDYDYVDNSLCIELLTSQPTGILSYLDRETLDIHHGSTKTLLEKLHNKHSGHSKFKSVKDQFQFTIVHHNTEVVYDAKSLFLSNDDSIVDDVIRTFSKENCNFGFVSHLFANDLKSTLSCETSDGENFLHKISHNFNESTESVSHNSGILTLSKDFQGKLDGLLEKIVQTQPWFILCLKSNSEQNKGVFDEHTVSQQVKSLQIFETIYLLRAGYTHRMRVLLFAQRYFAIQDDKLTQEDAMDIAKSYHSLIINEARENPNKRFFVGKKYVLFSELVWQDLEKDRKDKETDWMRRSQVVEEETVLFPEQEVCYQDDPTILVEDFTETPRIPGQIDMSTPPPIPKRRSYTVIDNKKIRFPQIRVMKNSYRDIQSGKEVVFQYGETVRVVGASPKSGFLNVENKDKTGCVPYKLTALLGDNS